MVPAGRHVLALGWNETPPVSWLGGIPMFGIVARPSHSDAELLRLDIGAVARAS